MFSHDRFSVVSSSRCCRQFDSTVRRLLIALPALFALCAQPASADVVQILDSNHDAFRARINLICSAQSRVEFACFELLDDELSYAFLALLRDAARRGVEVQVVVDAFGDRVPQPVYNHLIRQGVQIRRYHPLRLTEAHRYLCRMHDKLLLVDGRTMILGGRNMGAPYYGLSQKQNFLDRDVLISGPAVGDADAYFRQLWNSCHVVPMAPGARNRTLMLQSRRQRFSSTARQAALWPDSPICLQRFSVDRLLDESLSRLLARTANRTSSAFLWQSVEKPTEAIRFLHSSRLWTAHNTDISDELLALIKSARRRIVVETPHLVLTKQFETALSAAVRRGVRVQLLTNSLATTNRPVVHAGYVNQKRKMLQSGIEVWEYQGPNFLHAKAMVVDDVAVIGSYNLHPRSQYFDTEVAVAIRDPQLAAALRLSIENHRSAAVRAGSAPGYCLSRQLGGLPQRRRIAWMTLLRLAAPLIERHL